MAPPSQFEHSCYLGHCQLCGITGHSTWQCSHLPTSTLDSLPPTLARAPNSTFIAPYAHTTVHPSTPSTSLDWVVESGASHHVTIDLAALALHASYTTSDSVIIGDGSRLLIANIGSFSLTSLLTPYFFLMSYICLPCLRILFRSRLFVSITILMSYSLTLSFRCKIVTWGSSWFAGSVETVSITGRS